MENTLKGKRIALIASWYATPENPRLGSFFMDQAQALAELGAEVYFIAPQWRSLRALRNPKTLLENRFQLTIKTHPNHNNIHMVEIKGWNSPIKKFTPEVFSWMCQRSLAAVIKRFGKPHLIHAHSSVWAGYAASQLGIPYIVTEHHTGYSTGYFSELELQKAKQGLDGARKVVAVSHFLRHTLTPLTSNAIDVIPNIVDEREFTLQASQRPMPQPFVFFGLAFMTARKGFDTIIKAFAQNFKGQNAQLVLGGDGPERATLEQLCVQLGISPQVKFLGLINRAQVIEQLSKTHCFVHASHIETFGVVLIEAQMMGLPLVVTNSGPTAEFITPHTGVLVNIGDHQAFAAGMTHVQHNYQHFQAEHIRQQAIERYGQASFKAAISQLVHTVVTP